ncbi:MAG: sterol desaturase family protein [Tissierellales bacterium]|jgi:sterol desaturase/sphingolipid hydroxylase (fatty acid hydroxylase superfamily)|nr:sterol desaturase family protein [Tissierellales bacterium]
MYLILSISAILLSSLIEYLYHRLYLHHSAEIDHIKSHHAQFRGSKFSVEQANLKEIVSSKKYILLNILPYGLISLYIGFDNLSFGIIFFSFALLYTLWVEVSHYIYHKPMGYFFENTKTFKRLKRHHKLHHSYYIVNYGIGSRHWDFILRSFRRF